MAKIIYIYIRGFAKVFFESMVKKMIGIQYLLRRDCIVIDYVLKLITYDFMW